MDYLWIYGIMDYLLCLTNLLCFIDLKNFKSVIMMTNCKLITGLVNALKINLFSLKKYISI